jgi:hypothetical protein
MARQLPFSVSAGSCKRFGNARILYTDQEPRDAGLEYRDCACNNDRKSNFAMPSNRIAPSYASTRNNQMLRETARKSRSVVRKVLAREIPDPRIVLNSYRKLLVAIFGKIAEIVRCANVNWRKGLGTIRQGTSTA